jgi:hypothetical protein
MAGDCHTCKQMAVACVNRGCHKRAVDACEQGGIKQQAALHASFAAALSRCAFTVRQGLPYVIVRQGSPHFVRDLENVSAGFARTVIVLHPDSSQDASANMVRRTDGRTDGRTGG